MKYERFYLQVTGNHISIIHRPTHTLLGFLSLEDKVEAKSKIEELIKLPQSDFLNYLTELNLHLAPTAKTVEDLMTEDKENWLKNAWSSTTVQALKALGITDVIPTEDFNLEHFKELRQAKHSKKSKVAKGDEEGHKRITKLKASKNSLKERPKVGTSSTQDKTIKRKIKPKGNRSKLKLKSKRLRASK